MINYSKVKYFQGGPRYEVGLPQGLSMHFFSCISVSVW